MSDNGSGDDAKTHGDTDKLTVYILSGDWSGLHDMFEKEDWSLMAGVPLVPLYWKGLADKGYNVHVFVWGAFSSEKDFVLEGVHFHRRYLPKWTTADVGERRYMAYFKIAWLALQIKAYREVRRQAKIDPPDALYSYHATFISINWLLSRLMRIPHLVHRWGTWMGHYLFKVPWYKRWSALPTLLSYKIPVDWMVISNDGTLGDKVVEHMKFPQERFRFWLDGTSPGIYQPDADIGAVKESVGLKPTDKMIFQAARLDVWKRIDRTIAALPTVLERNPNAYLAVAGGGHLQKTLEKQAQELGVAEHVKFLGFVPHAKVLELHNAADLFVTVQDLTNLGNQIMEALHSRTCVVAYDIGATRDVMIDGVTGVLLSEKDLPQLGNTISDLLCDDERRDKLAQGALDFARENIWTWPQRIDAEVDELKRLVGEYRARNRRHA